MASSVIKAVLFDMDGVLIDAKEWHYESLNQALLLFGHFISRYDHLTSFDGLPTRVKLEMLSKTEGLPVQLHTFINELKQAYTMQHVYQKCSPSFIHQYALSRLKAAGYEMAVCSNSVRKSVVTMMDLAGLTPYLDAIWSAEDVSASKPDPEMYAKAIRKFQLNPQEVLIVEDNDNGVKAALASKAHCLVVNSVSEVCYDRIISKIKELNNQGVINANKNEYSATGL